MLCKVGNVEVWRILEIHEPFLTPEELYPTAGPEVAAIMESRVPGCLCSQAGRLILPIQSFLLKTPSHLILVDSCVGNDKSVPRTPNWHKRSDNRFESSLKAAGVSFDDIDYVLCTHLHTDHVGWNTQLVDGRWVPTFPKARYPMPAADEEFQRSVKGDLYLESVLPVVEAGQVELVRDEHMLGDHVQLMPTPGHTPGHVSVLIKCGEREAVITGDAIHSTVQCWHPDWYFKYDANAEMAVESRIKLLQHAVETGCTVLGSHFALPSIGKVESEGQAFRWKE
jgi:glyoxylase-like metal-dependent hydrolase (beta-lactamase superfamily II)